MNNLNGSAVNSPKDNVYIPFGSVDFLPHLDLIRIEIRFIRIRSNFSSIFSIHCSDTSFLFAFLNIIFVNFIERVSLDRKSFGRLRAAQVYNKTLDGNSASAIIVKLYFSAFTTRPIDYTSDTNTSSKRELYKTV